jgi:hypothetical protein
MVGVWHIQKRVGDTNVCCKHDIKLFSVHNVDTTLTPPNKIFPYYRSSRTTQVSALLKLAKTSKKTYKLAMKQAEKIMEEIDQEIDRMEAEDEDNDDNDDNESSSSSEASSNDSSDESDESEEETSQETSDESFCSSENGEVEN